MQRILRVTTLLLLPLSMRAAEFRSGQAARMVFGQPSFGAAGAGITASNLLVANGRLYVTGTAHRVLVFDLANIPGPNDELAPGSGTRCVLCRVSPASIVNEPMLEGSPAVSIYGHTVVVADTANHRVLIWRDTSFSGANRMPDVVLGQPTSDSFALSASTIVEPSAVTFDGKRLFVADTALKRVLVWNSLPSVNNQAADAVLGQENFTSVDAAGIPRADTLHRPIALASDGINLFVADSQDRRILVFTAADNAVPKNAIVNSASLIGEPFAPGSLITISADGLADGNASAPDDGSRPLPTTLGGVEVIFNGVPLPLLSVSRDQIRVQLPYVPGNTSSASVYVRTKHTDGSVSITNAIAVKMERATPGLFAFGGAEPRSGLILHATASSGIESGTPVTPENPAKAGETVIVWAAGLGAVRDSDVGARAEMGVPYAGSDAEVVTPVSALVNGRSTQVASARLPQGSIGIYEVHIVLPPDLDDNPKTLLLIAQNGHVSNRITVPVKSGSH